MPKMWYENEPVSKAKLVGKAINRLRFKSNIWKPAVEEGTCDYNRLYKMVNDIRTLAGLDPVSWQLLGEGVDYFPGIFSDNYRYALSEFKHFIWIDW